MKPARLLAQDLERIQQTDDAAGVDLQTSPLAWQQRRQLLAHLTALDEDRATEARLVLELSALLEPVSGGAASLEELVARIRAMQSLQAEVQAAMLQRQHDDMRIKGAFHPQSVIGDILDRDAEIARATPQRRPAWADFGSLDNGRCSWALIATGEACCLPAGHAAPHAAAADVVR